MPPSGGFIYYLLGDEGIQGVVVGSPSGQVADRYRKSEDQGRWMDGWMGWQAGCS